MKINYTTQQTITKLISSYNYNTNVTDGKMKNIFILKFKTYTSIYAMMIVWGEHPHEFSNGTNAKCFSKVSLNSYGVFLALDPDYHSIWVMIL